MAERQVVATLLAAGAKDLDMPSVEAVREQFDAALLAEHVVLDRRQFVLRQALGVA